MSIIRLAWMTLQCGALYGIASLAIRFKVPNRYGRPFEAYGNRLQEQCKRLVP